LINEDLSGNSNFPALQKVSGNAVAVRNSPQFEAAVWLLNHDKMELTWENAGFLSRYALATLYYALDGANWKKALNWLGSVDICIWQGVCCLEDSLSGCNRVFAGQSISLKLRKFLQLLDNFVLLTLVLRLHNVTFT